MRIIVVYVMQGHICWKPGLLTSQLYHTVFAWGNSFEQMVSKSSNAETILGYALLTSEKSGLQDRKMNRVALEVIL